MYVVFLHYDNPPYSLVAVDGPQHLCSREVFISPHKDSNLKALPKGLLQIFAAASLFVHRKSRTVKSPGFGVELKYAKHQLYARLYVIGAAISTGAPPQC